MTNEKITEILDRCNGRFGWVQIHMDTEENYLLMPLADLVELLEKQLPKPIYEHIDTRLIYKVRYDKFRCSECGFTTKSLQMGIPHSINIAHSADGGLTGR